MGFPSTCPNFCLVGVDLTVPLKNIWTVGEKNRRTVPNCGCFYCVVVTENTVPTLLFLVDASPLAPSSLSDEGRRWHVSCCGRGERSPPNIRDPLGLQLTCEEMRIRFWYSQGAFAMHGRGKMGDWHAPHLSAKLPVSILVLVLTFFLFVLLTIANPLLPQFFLGPPFPFLFTSVSPFLTERILFSKMIWTHQYPILSTYISFWGKVKKEKKILSLGSTSAKLRFKATLSSWVATTRSRSLAVGWLGTRLTVLAAGFEGTCKAQLKQLLNAVFDSTSPTGVDGRQKLG